MKTNFIIRSIFFLMCAQQINAQVNNYLIHQPVWKISSTCSVSYPCVQQETYNYCTNGDTLFNAFVYKKIVKKGYGYYSWMAMPPASPGCNGSYNYNYTSPWYFIRSAGKKMFLRQPADTSEYLLYDFNLLVGDTLPVSYNNYATDITVTAIDSIYTSSGFRKRFQLAGGTWSTYLLEGIGHSKGLVEPMNFPLECGYNLDCYSLNDTAYYPIVGAACNINVGLQTYQRQKSCSVFPNPMQTHTTFQFNTYLNHADISIYNQVGQLIKSIHNLSGQSYNIERGLLSEGIYFYDIKEQGQPFATGKLIVMQ